MSAWAVVGCTTDDWPEAKWIAPAPPLVTSDESVASGCCGWPTVDTGTSALELELAAAVADWSVLARLTPNIASPTDLVNAVKDFVDSKVLMKQSVSVTDIGKALQISPSTAWRILRKRLGWYPYKPRTVVPLSNRHKEARVTFCTWLLE